MTDIKKPTIRIYGVKLADPEFRTAQFETGAERFKGTEPVQFTDIPIEEIIGSARFGNKFNELFNACRNTNLDINFDPNAKPNATKKLRL